MKVSVTKRDLLEALDKVRGVVATNKMIQLLTCFCFRGGKLFGFNGQEGCITSSPLGELEFAVDAKLFYAAVSKSFDEMEVTLKEGTIMMKSGSNKSQLQTVAVESYPEFLPTKKQDFCTASNVVNCLERVSFTVATNAMKPQLLGAAISEGYVYSCDGVRISRAKLSEPSMGMVTVPSSSVEHICKLGAADGVSVELNQSGKPGRAIFHYPKDTMYVTALLANDFPTGAVDDMLAQKVNEEYTSELPDELSQAIDRVNILSTEEAGLIVTNNPGKGLKICASTKEVGEAEEILPWNFAHQFKFAVRADRLKKAFERTRRVDFTDVISGECKVLRFEDEGFQHLCALVLMTE